MTEVEEGILKHLSSLETFLRKSLQGFHFRESSPAKGGTKVCWIFASTFACRSASAGRQGNDTINWAIEDWYQSAKVLHFFLEGEAVIPKEERIGEKRDNDSLNFR